MDWQQPASLAVIALTGFLFVRREIRLRRRARSRACGGAGCSCGDATGAGDPAPPGADRDIESQA